MAGTRLLLVRHGESVAQVEGVVGGPKGCRGLTELGRRQVAALRDRWKDVGQTADVLLASTLPRALETAEILSEGLGGIAVEPVQELCEIMLGECDGMLWTDFEARYQGEDYRWDPHRPFAPGAESWVDFQARVGRAIAEIVERHEGQRVVAAVHGGVIDGSMVHFLGLPADAGHVLQSHNSSVTEWRHLSRQRGPGSGDGGWRLVRFNDHAHLESLMT